MIKNDINLLDEIGLIRNKGALLRIIGKKSGTPAKQVDNEIINNNAKLPENIALFDKTMVPVSKDNGTAKYLLIYTGYNTSDTNDNIYICMTRTVSGTWEGGRAGTFSQLSNEFASVNVNSEDTKSSLNAQPEQEQSISDIPDKSAEEIKATNSDKENLHSTIPKKTETANSSVNYKEDDILHIIPDEKEDSEKITPPVQPYHEQIQKMENKTDCTLNSENNMQNYTENINEAPDTDKVEQNETVDIPIYQENNKSKHVCTENNSIVIENAANVNIDNSILVLNKSWVSENSSNSALQYYIDSICTYAYTHPDKQDMITNGNNMYVINTGILDKYGHDIYVEFHVTENDNIIIIDKYQIVESKSTLLDEGFSHEDIKKTLKPVTVWDKHDETIHILSAEYDDFDFMDRSILSNLISSKAEMFNSRGITVTPYGLTRRIEESVQLALQINQRDHEYIRPAYDKRSGEIHFLIPLRIESSMDDEPEFVLEIAYKNGFYSIYDIITPNEAYLKAKVISPYRTIQ